MKRVWQLTLTAFAVLATAPVLFGQTTFTLGFDADGPSDFSGNAGDPWAGACTATLSAEGGGTGAQGWSISLSADNAAITAITTDGTDANSLFSGGFKKSELTAKGTLDCVGLNGAVSAFVLSFTEPITLPPAPSKASIAKVAVGGTIPAGGGSATVRYVEGCQGAGQPVSNNVTQDGNTVKPVLTSKTINLREIVSFCNKALNVGFSAATVSSPDAYSGIVDGGSGLCDASGGEIRQCSTTEGDAGNFNIYANISSNNAGGGAQGWSLSIALDGDMDFGPAGVTTNGAPGVDNNFSGGFKKTEIIDPNVAPNNGQRGLVSAIVLSFTEPKVLPPTGTETVLCINLVGSSAPAEGSDVSGSLRFLNGLKGAGQPVTNAITVEGGTRNIDNLGTANVKITACLEPVRDCRFVRGNANDDAKVNIADPIWILNELFRAGPATGCPDAADANDDGMVDSADAVYLINHQFLAGPEPTAPYGPIPAACDIDPTPDALPLGASQSSCP